MSPEEEAVLTVIIEFLLKGKPSEWVFVEISKNIATFPDVVLEKIIEEAQRLCSLQEEVKPQQEKAR